MGLVWFLVFWKWRAVRTGDERYAAAARFWAKIFGLNFAVGVVTGIPMEFQFGTNWSNFSKHSGGVTRYRVKRHGGGPCVCGIVRFTMVMRQYRGKVRPAADTQGYS